VVSFVPVILTVAAITAGYSLLLLLLVLLFFLLTSQLYYYYYYYYYYSAPSTFSFHFQYDIFLLNPHVEIKGLSPSLNNPAHTRIGPGLNNEAKNLKTPTDKTHTKLITAKQLL
jgi:hypothetical protein